MAGCPWWSLQHPGICSRPLSHDVTGHGSMLANLHLNERGLDDGSHDIATTYVNQDLVTQLGGRAKECQADSLFQGWRECAGGDLTQDRAIGRLDLAVVTRNTAAADEQAPADPHGTRGLLGNERILAPERVLLPADSPAGPRLHRRDVQAQVMTMQRVSHLGA